MLYIFSHHFSASVEGRSQDRADCPHPRNRHAALHRLQAQKLETELWKSVFLGLSCQSSPQLQSSHLSCEVRTVSNFSWPKLLPVFLCSTQQPWVFAWCLWSMHLGNKLLWCLCKGSLTGKGVEVKLIVESAVINKRILLWRGSRGTWEQNTIYLEGVELLGTPLTPKGSSSLQGRVMLWFSTGWSCR